MAEPPPSQFWADLEDNLKFRRAYVAAALEIQATDRAANQPPAMRAEDVPDELIDRARKAWVASARGHLPGHGMAHALAAVLPAYEAMVRAKVAEEIERQEARDGDGSSWGNGMRRAAAIARGEA